MNLGRIWFRMRNFAPGFSGGSFYLLVDVPPLAFPHLVRFPLFRGARVEMRAVYERSGRARRPLPLHARCVRAPVRHVEGAEKASAVALMPRTRCGQ